MTPSCPDCWTRAEGSVARYRELLSEHADNQPVLVHENVSVFHADAHARLRLLPDESVHAVVTDPPYGLADHKPERIVEALTAWANGDRESVPDGRGFMGRKWDGFVPPPAVWDECLRVLKPGGHLLCFAGTRTVDLMGLSIRLAGFELRDSITWLYGSGMPKGINVSKAIDKAAGAEREVVGSTKAGASSLQRVSRVEHGYRENLTACTPDSIDITAPATDAARQWDGWNTSLKPSAEPIIVARKPLGERTVAANVLAHGTGGLNVDSTRVAHASEDDLATSLSKNPGRDGETVTSGVYGTGRPQQQVNVAGRWPANVVLDEHMALELDAQSGITTSSNNPNRFKGAAKFKGTTYAGDDYSLNMTSGEAAVYADTGGASRFFYYAKAPTKERPKVNGIGHATVKPLTLMRWLVRLVTPPGGTVLDPFAGSGTTGEAAAIEGFAAVLIERDPAHIPLIVKRLTGHDPEPVEIEESA